MNNKNNKIKNIVFKPPNTSNNNINKSNDESNNPIVFNNENYVITKRNSNKNNAKQQNEGSSENENEGVSTNENQNEESENKNEGVSENANSNNIRTIIFSNNEKINNSENENIIFNNLEEENITKFIFNQQDVIIKENIAIQNKNIIYKDDIVYLEDLINQLLSEYPVTLQDNKYIQKEVQEVANKIIEAKNYGIKNNNMLEKGIEYPFIDDIINNKFRKSKILPIIFDKHVIYTKIQDSDKNKNNDINYKNEGIINFIESLENKEGIFEENQIIQNTEIKKLYHEKALNKIDYKNYINKFYHLIKAHFTKYDKNDTTIGYIKNPKDSILALRYYDYDTIQWNTYKTDNDYTTSKDIFNEIGKIKGIEENVFIKGSDINIVGFMVLSVNNDIDTMNKSFKKIGEITKIANINNAVLIECKDHKLSNDNFIYIQESNSFPNINGKYLNNIKIINKDTIELVINNKLINEGNHGILYSINKLEFDLYEIFQKDDNLNIEFKRSTYSEAEINNNHNKVYLFDNTNINKLEYNEIIKNIIPSLDYIYKTLENKIKGAYTFDDVNNIIKPYSININDFNINQIKNIKIFLSKNLDKILNVKNNSIKINLNKNNKKLFENNSYFLANQYITDKNIETIYGKYIHLNKPQDNFILRLRWIESQKDNGTIYYLNYLLKNKIDVDKTYIQQKITELSDLLEMLQNNFNKEKNINNKNKSSKIYRFNTYIITESDAEDNFKNLKNTLLDDTVVFYKNNIYLWKGKLIEFKNLEDNTLALVEKDIWVWKNNIWIKSDAVSKYDNIKYLCELNNIDLSDLKLDSLDCIYRKDIGCHTKLYIRLHNNIIKIDEYLKNFKKINESFNHNNINNKIDYFKKIYFSSILLDNILNDNVSAASDDNVSAASDDNVSAASDDNVKIEIINDNLTKILNKLKKINNYDKRLEYIYLLIEKDGLLINNEIYSKKYKRKMNFCAHYNFFKKIYYADSPDEKVKLTDLMLTKYSDYGEDEKNNHICKVCGEILLNNDYDESAGFTATGALKISRDLWVDETKEIKTNTLNYKEFDDDTLKIFLLNYGLSFDNIEEALSVYNFIVKNLFPKSGAKVPNKEIINIIIESIQKIKNIPSYAFYKNKEIKKLQEKGFSKIDIEKQDLKGIFDSGYKRYLKIKKSSIIVSRFLISVQTNIPNIIRTSKLTICPFYSFNGEEGISYMACILNEMKIVILKEEKQTFEILKVSILESYNDFKNSMHIKKLFRNKENYEKGLFDKIEDYKFKNEILEINNQLIEPIKVGDEYNELIKSVDDIESIKKLENILINRLKFLAKSIVKVVKDVIAESPISDYYIPKVESSCCTEVAEQYINYYYYIELKSSELIKFNIDESRLIFNYMKYFINKGSIHRFILYDKNKFDGIYNTFIIDNEINTSRDIINKVFEIFVDTGIYAGTLREYIEDIDIKTGLNKNKIISKDYTIKEYQNLLRNIEKHNIKYYKKYETNNFDKDELDSLKKDSIQNLDKIINNLVKNVANILNKDEKFINKYTELIRNFGIFDEFSIKKTNKKKLDYIKKFYITKLKKYLSIIKNKKHKNIDNIKLNFIEDETIAKEMQIDIYNEYNKLEEFLHENIQKYFIDLSIDYTNDEINSITGIDNIYDSKYEKIKVYSNFNFNDAGNVLLYILISQLNNLLQCNAESEYESPNNNRTKCTYIAKFILILFEDLDSDNDLFNICKKDVEGIQNSLIHDKIEFKIKQYLKDEDYLSKMASKGTEEDMDEIDENEDNDIMEKCKNDFISKYGTEPTNDELETYKNDYLKNIEEEYEYDLDDTVKGADVMDQGAGYGEFNEFDFEDGDGFIYDPENE
jgi:hypothetical protein